MLFYKDRLSEEEVLNRTELGGQLPTMAYGVAVRHLVEGRRERAIALLREIVAEPYWARLGHVAAEADLMRLDSEDQ